MGPTFPVRLVFMNEGDTDTIVTGNSGQSKTSNNLKSCAPA